MLQGIVGLNTPLPSKKQLHHQERLAPHHKANPRVCVSATSPLSPQRGHADDPSLAKRHLGQPPCSLERQPCVCARLSPRPSHITPNSQPSPHHSHRSTTGAMSPSLPLSPTLQKAASIPMKAHWQHNLAHYKAKVRPASLPSHQMVTPAQQATQCTCGTSHHIH